MDRQADEEINKNLLSPFSLYVFRAGQLVLDNGPSWGLIPGENWFSLSQQPLRDDSSSSRCGVL